MPNLYFQIQNIDMQIQNLGAKINMKNNMMPNMNMYMQIPNIGFQNQNMMMNNDICGNMNAAMNDQIGGCNLGFREKNGKIINIYISPEKTIKDAIDLYKIKSGNNSEELMFIFNGKPLNPDRKISQSGLLNDSRIIVMNTKELYGG